MPLYSTRCRGCSEVERSFSGLRQVGDMACQQRVTYTRPRRCCQSTSYRYTSSLSPPVSPPPSSFPLPLPPPPLSLVADIIPDANRTEFIALGGLDAVLYLSIFYILYFIFYILYFIFYILYFIFYILYFIFYILYFIFYILYFVSFLSH